MVVETKMILSEFRKITFKGRFTLQLQVRYPFLKTWNAAYGSDLTFIKLDAPGLDHVKDSPFCLVSCRTGIFKNGTHLLGANLWHCLGWFHIMTPVGNSG